MMMRLANADIQLGPTTSSRIILDAMNAWSTVAGTDLHLFEAGSAATGASIAGGACDGRSVIQFNDPHDEVADLEHRLRAHACVLWGSRASRRPSPMKLMHSERMMKKAPGNTTSHQ